MSLWRNHSLTIVIAGVGLVTCGVAFLFPAGKMFDLFLTLGGGLLTVAFIYLLSGPLHEKNKPDK